MGHQEVERSKGGEKKGRKKFLRNKLYFESIHFFFFLSPSILRPKGLEPLGPHPHALKGEREVLLGSHR